MPPSPGFEDVAAARVGFADRLRVAALPSLVAVFLRVALSSLHPLLTLLSYLAVGAAGSVSARLWEQRHGKLETPGRGAAVGLAAGVLCALVTLGLQFGVLLAQDREAILAPVREQARAYPMAQEALALMEDPAFFFAVFAVGALIEVALLVGLCTAGGAIAVKLRIAEQGPGSG